MDRDVADISGVWLVPSLILTRFWQVFFFFCDFSSSSEKGGKEKETSHVFPVVWYSDLLEDVELIEDFIVFIYLSFICLLSYGLNCILH